MERCVRDTNDDILNFTLFLVLPHIFLFACFLDMLECIFVFADACKLIFGYLLSIEQKKKNGKDRQKTRKKEKKDIILLIKLTKI